MKALLFCAGLGTRLMPLTKDKPKALVEINDKTLLQWNLEKLKAAGIDQVFVNVHHFGDLIIDFLKENNNFGMQIVISDESPKLLDTGGGLKKVSAKLDQNENLLIHNVDIISSLNLNDLMDYHIAENASATLAVRSRQTSRYLIIDDDSFELMGWTNIKTGELKLSRISSNTVTNFAFNGIHIINSKAFQHLPDEEVFSIIDFYLELAKHQKVIAYPDLDTNWVDVGKPENIPHAEKLLIQP